MSLFIISVFSNLLTNLPALDELPNLKTLVDLTSVYRLLHRRVQKFEKHTRFTNRLETSYIYILHTITRNFKGSLAVRISNSQNESYVFSLSVLLYPA